MPKIKLHIPEKVHFETEMDVRIRDINYGGHLGNDMYLSYIHEARVRFLNHYRFSELDVDGVGLIMRDAALVFREEVFYGAVLKVLVTVDEITNAGCDMYYRLIDSSTGNEVLQAKTGIAFFDYKKRKVARTPETFKSLFKQE
jgi:acyl-CoA thioesterase FadM